jgi:hypothetical protein
VLWHIGNADGKSDDLTPVPDASDSTDGILVVGLSDPARDWPCVHLGASGAIRHTFSVVFGTADTPKDGPCRITVALVNAYFRFPPRLLIEVNGHPFEAEAPLGSGRTFVPTASPASPAKLAVEFPATLLKPGVNRIDLTNLYEGWFIYDSVTLESPLAVETAAVSGLTFLPSVAASVAPVESAGRTFTKITATVVHTGDPADASIRIDGRELQPLRLTRGHHVLELLVPAEDKVRKADLSVVVDGQPRANRQVTLTPPLREVVIVFKTHFDIGYTDLAVNVVQKYRTTMIDSALEVVDQNRDLPRAQQFVWTIPGV